MKTILINYTGRHGAGNVVAFEMSKELQKIGYKIIVIISKYIDNRIDWINLKPYKLIELKTYRTTQEFIISTINFKLNEKYKLKEQLLNEKIDCIYCPMATMWSNMINNLFMNIPIIVVDHDPKPHLGLKFKIINILGHGRKIMKSADYIIVHSKCFIDFEEKKYNKRGKVVYIALGRHNIYSKIENKISVITYKKDKVNFLFFGTITKYKGLHVLSKAYKDLSDKYKNITLTIAGEGDFSQYKEEYNKLPNVTVINRYITDEEVESLFNGENIISVLPYIDATQSGVILVAMDYAVPVIATKTGGLAEQICDNKTGILVEPSNPKQLMNAMERFIIEPDLKNKINSNVKDYIETLNWDNSAKKLNRLINTIFTNIDK